MLAVRAPSSCHPLCCDGVSYSHALYDRQNLMREEWDNPERNEHPIQCTLVKAYSRLISAANLTPKLVRDAFNPADRRPLPPAGRVQADLGIYTEEVDEVPNRKKRRKPRQR